VVGNCLTECRLRPLLRAFSLLSSLAALLDPRTLHSGNAVRHKIEPHQIRAYIPAFFRQNKPLAFLLVKIPQKHVGAGYLFFAGRLYVGKPHAAATPLKAQSLAGFRESPSEIRNEWRCGINNSRKFLFQRAQPLRHIPFRTPTAESFVQKGPNQ